MSPTTRYCKEILDALHASIVVIGSNFRIVETNRAARDLGGRNREEVIGRKCHEVLHASEKPCADEGAACPLQTVMATGRSVRYVHQHRTGAGKVRWEEICAAPIKDERGRPIYMVEELNDISEVLQTKEIVQQLASEVHTLRGILPLCAKCKSVRNDDGYWETVEVYISQHSEAEITHGICPDCAKKLYPEYFDAQED